MKEVWRENTKNKIDQAGVNDFKYKVNIMLQNQMYLNKNVNGKSFQEAQSKFDQNMWQPKEQGLDSKLQHVPGMGYGYVLGINELRDLKESKKKNDEYDDIYQANYENILLKNNRNQSVRKTNSNQRNDEIEGI